MVDLLVIYGGIKYIIVRCAIYCKVCKDVIISEKYLKYCFCGKAGIDEGRILGNVKEIENRSMYCALINKKFKLWLPEHLIPTLQPLPLPPPPSPPLRGEFLWN